MIPIAIVSSFLNRQFTANLKVLYELCFSYYISTMKSWNGSDVTMIIGFLMAGILLVGLGVNEQGKDWIVIRV